MTKRIAALHIAICCLFYVGCSKQPNLHEAEGVEAAVEKLMEHVDGSTEVYQITFRPNDAVTPDARAADLRYRENGTMMFRHVSFGMANQMAPRTERLDAMRSHTPRALRDVDFSRIAANVMESSRYVPDDMNFAAVGSYTIELDGQQQRERWVLHGTPTDGSSTRRIGNTVEITYTEYHFELADDGTVSHVQR